MSRFGIPVVPPSRLEYVAAVAVCAATYLLASSCAASSGAPVARFGPPVIAPVPAAWYAPAPTEGGQ